MNPAKSSSATEIRLSEIGRIHSPFKQAAGTPGESSADQLHKLADLKSQGVLTDAEFEAQKAKILS